ncbi:MAG TPA: hypothetical protein VGG10_18730 [Rhizomicrobium sp.]
MATLLHAAFEQLGGVDYLVKWGENEQTAFVNALIKVLPLRDDESAPLEVRDDAARAELAAKLDRIAGTGRAGEASRPN